MNQLKKTLLCTNENTSELLAGKQSIVDGIFPLVNVSYNYAPIINQVGLSRTEVFASAKNERIEILVRVSAIDTDNDVLTYAYNVSGGEIIDQGASVTWNLTGVKPGTYTITAAVDDECGVCAKPMTETVFVK